jgi:hypothetical protein
LDVGWDASPDRGPGSSTGLVAERGTRGEETKRDGDIIEHRPLSAAANESYDPDTKVLQPHPKNAVVKFRCDPYHLKSRRLPPEPMMPRKSPGHDSRVITYRTLPGSSPHYQRVNAGECTAWVQTKLAFDLEVRGPGGTNETKPYTVDTFREHHGAVEPTLYLTPTGRWVRRLSFQELPSLKPKPSLYMEITQPLATEWLWANGYPVPGGAAPIEANAGIRARRAPSPEQVHAHRLWQEGYFSQTEIAREIERVFHTSYTQPQVSRAVKRVDDWLQATEANPPTRRPKRTISADPSWNEPKPKVSGSGRRAVRKVVDDDDDD